MRKVIKRKIKYNEYSQPVKTIDKKTTYEVAEKIHGQKLDRRRNYMIIDNEVLQESRFTKSCSGCSDDSEYSYCSRGAGCDECGYQGVVVTRMFVQIINTL